MARPRKWPPSILFHKCTGNDRVRINGQEITLGPHGSAEAREKYLRIVQFAEANGGQVPPEFRKGGGLTVAELVAQFLVHAEQTYPKTSREPVSFRYAVAPLVALYGSAPAASFDSVALETVQRALTTGSWMNDAQRARRLERKQPIGLCRNVANRHTVRIQTMWRWADRKRFVPPGSYHNLLTVGAIPKNAGHVRQTKKIRPSSWDDVEKVIAALDQTKRGRGNRAHPSIYKHPVSTMLALQWKAGMRSCEVRLMRTADIDRSGPVWIYTPPKDKNAWREDADDAPRRVPLGPECQELLAGWLQPDKPDIYLFTVGKSGRPYETGSYANAVRRGAQLAGVKLTPYQGRHAAKRRIARIHGLHGARQVLGQRSIGTTAQYDAELDLEQAQEIMKNMG